MAVTNVRSQKAVDPFLSFRFIVSWAPGGGAMTPCAYISKVSALTKTTEKQSWREGGAPQGARVIPGQTSYTAITLTRGITLDNAFEQWANKIWYYPNSNTLGQNMSLDDFRKDIKIDVLNQAGQIVLTYYVFNCWPSSYTAVPELDANTSSVAIETLVLENEGWSRDDSVKPADPPKYDQPTANQIATFTAPS